MNDQNISDAVKIVTCTDWSNSPIEGIPRDVILQSENGKYQMGLYTKDGNEFYSSGYVGVSRLYDRHGDPILIEEDGKKKELVIKIKPRFGFDPWKMLEVVMQDDIEYDVITKTESDHFYEIYADQPFLNIPTAITHGDEGELLLVMSFIRACYSVCKKGIKSKMDFVNENCVGCVRGKINVSRQIKENVIRGRADRVYCTHTHFTIDTPENKILKSALKMAKDKLAKYHGKVNAFSHMIWFCEDTLVNVSDTVISTRLFSEVKINGFNSYYGPAIKLARNLINNLSVDVLNSTSSNGEVMPYAIKMEALFEFYIRCMVNKALKRNNFANLMRLEKYGDKFRTVIGNNNGYLMDNYLPDLALRKFEDGSFAAVLDAKYQPHRYRPTKHFQDKQRSNTHQLLFYAFMLNSVKCGFVFPQENNESNNTNDNNIYAINVQNDEGRNPMYSQWVLTGNLTQDDLVFDKIVQWVAGK